MFKQLLVLICLWGPLPHAYARVSEQLMQDVKVQLQRTAGLRLPPISLTTDTSLGKDNAWMSYPSPVIHVTVGMLNVWDDEHTVATVIAHEMCHYILKHGADVDGITVETDADICGRDLMVRAGYDAAKGAEFFSKALKRRGDIGPPSHPYFSHRIKFYQTGDKSIYQQYYKGKEVNHVR